MRIVRALVFCGSLTVLAWAPALAETAAKLNKRDEAIAEYNACLKLDPMEKEAKAARKALERLKP